MLLPLLLLSRHDFSAAIAFCCHLSPDVTMLDAFDAAAAAAAATPLMLPRR